MEGQSWFPQCALFTRLDHTLKEAYVVLTAACAPLLAIGSVHKSQEREPATRQNSVDSVQLQNVVAFPIPAVVRTIKMHIFV